MLIINNYDHENPLPENIKPFLPMSPLYTCLSFPALFAIFDC